MLKDIERLEGMYAITDKGEVWSYPKQQGFFFRKGKWLKPYTTKFGYQLFHWKIKGKDFNKTGHRLVAQAFIPNPLNLPCIAHLDNNPTNNSKQNLKWVTFKENSEYMVSCGRNHVGEEHHNAKLNNQSVKEIRIKYKKEHTSSNILARKFNVSKKTILNVLHRKIWKHI